MKIIVICLTQLPYDFNLIFLNLCTIVVWLQSVINSYAVLYCSQIWYSMIFTGFKRPLVDSDLWKLNHPDCSSVVTAQFMKNWNHELAAVQ